MKKEIILGLLVFALVGFLGIFLRDVSAQGSIGNTVCCEQTNTGAFCQNVPAEECNSNSRQVPTSCDSTSYCSAGTCYDSTEGTCLDNTPQQVCDNNGGIWSKETPPQCSLGCCILGDQAAYVSLVRCKRLSGFLGLETNYDTSIQSELACILEVQSQENGACVYEFEFERTCKFGTRAECDGTSSTGGNGTISVGTFYGNKLCSSEELGTICGPTTKTTLVDGKDEVYFVDSCGNPSNIYDSSKVNDLAYWDEVIPKEASCGNGLSNAGSSSCGNCDYLEGSVGRPKKIAGGSPTYGDFVCADLNCESTSNGNSYKHGESWCVNSDSGKTGNAENTVGSRFYKHICINGEEVLEQCGDFRAETCIENEIAGFSQAACRANRWQDCTSQLEQNDCENFDKRDCIWKEGRFLQLSQNSSLDERTGSCFPANTPGFNFWEDTETQSICQQGNAVCVVQFEEGIFGGEECVDNCECLEDDWEKERAEICSSLGDCGPANNWLGLKGNKEGYKVTTEEIDTESE